MQEIKKYQLCNKDIEITILNLGASIKSIIYGGVERVLSYTDIDMYRENPFYLGSVIGQNAGRISNGEFELDAKIYKLEQNDKSNNLHGGSEGLHSKYWDLEYYVNEEDNHKLKLSTNTFESESGFPGNVTYEAEYILEGSKVTLNLYAKADKKTYVNLTNHVYFNLNEDKSKTILNHSVQADASHYCRLNKDGIPISIEKSENTVFDLKKEKKLSEIDFLKDEQTSHFGGFDHPFIMDSETSSISCEEENIKIEIKSNNPCMVLYTGCNISEGVSFNESIKSEKYLGLCMEYQEEVNFMNREDSKDKVLEKDQEYSRYISWEFSKI